MRARNEEFLIEGRLFDGESFSELVFGPTKPNVETIRIANCEFRSCVVSPGEAAIRAGVIVENVVFDSLESDDSFVVSTNAALIDVRFTGISSRGGLWLRPDEIFDESLDDELRAWVVSKTQAIDCVVDIADYDAPHIEVLGLSPEKVVWDEGRHVLVDRSWLTNSALSELAMSPMGFWKSCLRRLRTFRVDSGIFRLPRLGERQFEVASSEAERLRECGLLS